MLPKLKTQKGREGGGVAKRSQLKFEILENRQKDRSKDSEIAETICGRIFSNDR